MTTGDPSALLALLGEADGVNAAAPEGMEFVRALTAGVARPVMFYAPPNTPTDMASMTRYAAKEMRDYHSLRFLVPTDTQAGHAAYEKIAATARGEGYQRESEEVFWIHHPESKPADERFTVQWKLFTDDEGTWWRSPSKRILLNSKFITPPLPEPVAANRTRDQVVNDVENSKFYRRDLARR